MTNNSKIHPFEREVATSELPPRFTYPFCYTPHKLCIEAAQMVTKYLASRADLLPELNQGKMLGVMVVQDACGKVGFLAAFSGNLAHSNHHSYFVPPVYDLLNPEGEFCLGEQQITAINHRIAALEADAHLAMLRQQYTAQRNAIEARLEQFAQQVKAEKSQRDALRAQGNLTAEQQQQMISRSQYLKAELRRRRQAANDEIAALPQAAEIEQIEQQISELKQQRRISSNHLQRRLFQLFVVSNARGESSDLLHIFKPTTQGVPPAGAGECAAPKLMQYALTHNLTPRCMAEFWWGASPVAEVRHHGNFYPACRSKCLPILSYMMQGMQVDPNPHQQPNDLKIKEIYDDEWLTVIVKPSGLASVPGNLQADSVLNQYSELHPEASGPIIVHRLDRDTSGLMILAKNKEVHKQLQEAFARRQITKTYEALLQGNVPQSQGTITLPLSPNINDRPRQMVDHEHGKNAVTSYRVMAVDNGITRIEFSPHTGRTHQLRVHAAHQQGLNAPIVGDPLYGLQHTLNNRLCLHAKSLQFTHPVTRQTLHFTSPAPF
ncbi:MAG: pseudouridine synthase [Muribaculaceae bacterium]